MHKKDASGTTLALPCYYCLRRVLVAKQKASSCCAIFFDSWSNCVRTSVELPVEQLVFGLGNNRHQKMENVTGSFYEKKKYDLAGFER